MKKLFLTSGLVLCMACPAFADPVIIHGSPYNNETNNECVEGVLGVEADGATANIEAIWNPVSYAINFAGGQAGSHTESGYVTGSTASVSPVTFDDKNISLTANGFSARGYQFDHWSSPVHLEDGVTTNAPYSYNNNASLSEYGYAGSATLTAIWTAKTYNVNYAAGTHGSGSSTDTNGATFDENYPIKGIGTGQGQSGVTADTGYHFVNWTGTSTDTAYTSANYTETQTITPYTIDAPLTLTANFAANTHTLTYDPGQHGTGGSTDTMTYDTPYTAKTATAANVTAANGYTFVGWNTADDQTSGNWTGISTWAAANDVDLTVYAAYTANSFTISYDCGGPIAGATAVTTGSETPSDQTVYMDGSFTLAQNTCVLQGYTFAGWSCPNLTGTPTLPANAQEKTMFAEGATGTYTYYQGGVTCTAQWTRNNITLQWNKNGADSADILDTSCTYDGAITLPTEPEKTGYTFGGWEVVTPTPAP